MRRLLAVAAAALLAGCTSSAGPSLRPVASGAVAGGVLRVGITTPGSLDPSAGYEPMGDLVVRTMCDPLIAADPRTGELEPSLVQSWVISDSGQRLVLRLRKGLRFSDGTSLTSDDVVATLSRIASPDVASASADLLSAIDGYAQVHGDAEADHDIDRRRLSGVRALDQQSVEITLVSRQADFLRVLTTAVTTPVTRSGLCSGPYALEKPYTAGASVIALRRVEGYRGADSTLTAGGRGYADRIEFRVFGTAALAAAAQRRGDVDLAAAAPGDRAHVQSGPSSLVEYVGFPTSTGPLFDKPPVRRALALALDRTALVAAVFPGTRVPATGFLPPTTLPVYRPGACADLPAGGDVPAALRLLAEAGVDLHGLTTSFYVNADGRNVQLARAVAAQWRRTLGLEVTVVASSFEDYLQRGVKGFDGPFRFSWATTYASPDGSLFPLFSTERIGRDNVARWSDRELDRVLVRQAREAEDEDDRSLEYRRAEQLLCDRLPMVPLTFSLARYLVAPGVSSAAGPAFLDRTTGQPLLRELYLR